MATVYLSTSPPSITPFSLSQSLTSAIHLISTRLPHHRSKILYDPASALRTPCSSTPHAIPTFTPRAAPIFVLVSDSDRVVFCLEFNPFSQYLVSISYLLPDHLPSLHVIGVTDECLQGPISTDDVKRVCGGPLHYHKDGSEKLALLYEESSFVFESKNDSMVLSKIKVGLTGSTQTAAAQLHVIVDSVTRRVVGVSIIGEAGKAMINLFFGDHYEDVVSKLGSASEVFYRDIVGRPPAMILSYAHLGLDVVIEPLSSVVNKIVLHTNTPNHREFCYYSRCFFQLSLTKCGLCADYGSADNILVTPVTNWLVLKSYINPERVRTVGKFQCQPSTNCTHPFPDTTLHMLFEKIIFEITSTSAIATVTLLSHDNHVTNSYETSEPVFRPPIHFREITLNCSRSSSPSSEEFYDCHDQEESFHSAQNSLTASDHRHQATESSSDQCAGELKALIGPNVNIVFHQSKPREVPSPTHPRLLYQFPDSPQTEHTEDNEHAEHTEHITVYESDTLRIVACPPEQSDLHSPFDDEGLQSFELISLDSALSNHSETRATLGDCNIATEHKEPEFVYQPKLTSGPSMVSSRTLTASHKEKSSSKRKEIKNRLLGPTESSKLRVRGKYTKEKAASDDTLTEEGGVPSESDVPWQPEGDFPSNDGSCSLDEGRESPHSDITAELSISQTEATGYRYTTPCTVSEGKGSVTQTLCTGGDQTASADTETLVKNTSGTSSEDQETTLDSETKETADSADSATLNQSTFMTRAPDTSASELVTNVGVTRSDVNVGVARAQWDTGQQYTPETGLPSMTQERVVEELITCEHSEMKSILEERLQTLQSVKDLLHSDPNKSAQVETLLAQDEFLADSMIAALNKSNFWSLSTSAMLLPWIQHLFSCDSPPRQSLLASQSVLCIADKHTTLLVRHKLGRARSLSVLERKQCIKCYVTLESIDESADALVSTLSNKQLTPEEEELLHKLRDVRTALAKILRKVDLA